MAEAGPHRNRSWVPVGLVVGASLLILGVLQPQLLLKATTPSGGDMGAHVFGPAFLRDVLIPAGRLMGWSNDWFAGFPAFYFYFPLPSLVIVLLDVFLPYGVAFKLVTVMGVVALPPAMAFLARSYGFSKPVAAVVAAGGAIFAFMESYSIYGGNIASTLAGEFSYSWSFALGLVYLGYFARAVDGERKAVPRAAVALGLAALSHILTTLVLVLATVPMLLRRKVDRKIAVGVWAWALAIAGFWAIPLVFRISYTSDMAWSPLRRWEEVFPIELWLLIPLAVVGAVWARRRTPRVIPLIFATLIPVFYYPLPTLLPEWAPDVFSDGRFKLWNGRLLPYWYFGIVFFASLAVGAGVLLAARRLPERLSPWWARAFIAGVAVVAVAIVVNAGLPAYAWISIVIAGLIALGVSLLVRSEMPARSFLTAVAGSALALGALAGVSFIDGWARWNYSGYESKDVYPEYQALMDTVEGLPPGRILWEANSDLNSYGTPMALMLFPYWDPGHQSMEGLYFESSLTTPFHFINAGEMSYAPSNPIPGLPYHNFDFDRGIRHLEQFGVRYYVAYTPEAREKADADPDLTRVAVSDPWAIYTVPESPMVEIAANEPAVYDPSLAGDNAPPFEDVILDWYDSPSLLDTWLAESGPSDWPRVGPDLQAGLAAAQPIDGGGTVSNVVVDEEKISFDTDRIGVPHLVKVSYFPNWEAIGAEGPWRAAPSLMIVIPTQSHVELDFARQTPEHTGWVLTFVGLGALVVWRTRRWSGRGEKPADPQKTA